MANTIAEAGAAGWGAAEGMRQAPIQTKLLSQKAEDNQRILDAGKQEDATKLAANARLTTANESLAGSKLSASEKSLKMYDLAIGNATNPAVKARLQKQQAGQLQQQADMATNKATLVQARKGQEYGVFSPALTLGTPESIQNLIDTGRAQNNAGMVGTGRMLNNQVKIPGTGKFYKDLTPEQQNDWKQKIQQHVAPNKLALSLSKQQVAEQRAEVAERRATEIAAQNARMDAWNREKLASTQAEAKKAAEESASNKRKTKFLEAANDIGDQITDKQKLHNKIIIEQGDEVDNPDAEWLTAGDSKIYNPNLALLESDIAALQTEKDRLLYEADLSPKDRDDIAALAKRATQKEKAVKKQQAIIIENKKELENDPTLRQEVAYAQAWEGANPKLVKEGGPQAKQRRDFLAQFDL